MFISSYVSGSDRHAASCGLTYDGSGTDPVLQQLLLQLLVGQFGDVDLLGTNPVGFPGGFLWKRKTSDRVEGQRALARVHRDGKDAGPTDLILR